MSDLRAVLQAMYVSVISTFSPISSISPRSLYRSRLLVCLAGLGLVVAACGGDNSAGSADSADSAEIAGGSLPIADSRVIGAGEPVAEARRSPGDTVEFDIAALSTLPLDASVVNYTPRQVPQPTIAAVVDTCAVLSTSAVDAIVADASSRHSFGQSPSFTATSRGAACDYRADTHRITLLVGSANQVGSNSTDSETFVPPAAGDITATSWDENAAIQILSEDSFGVDTAYAALTVVGDRGLRIDNTGGTGIDYSATGELFAELANAAAANVGSAPPPRSADELNAAAAVSGDPCSIWTTAELEAFFLGTPFSDPNASGANSCAWYGDGPDSAGLSLQLQNPDDTYSIDILEPLGSSQGVYTFRDGGLPVLVVIDDIPRATLRIDMVDGSIPDAAAAALAENLFARLTAQ